LKEIYPLIKYRHSTRHFLPKKVSDEDVNVILEAARWAPSSMNIQPWHFIVIKNKKLINLIWNASYYSQIGEKKLQLPPLMIGVVLDHSARPESSLTKDFEKHNSPNINYLNLAMPVLNMLYQATALGLSAGIKTPGTKEIKELLKLPEGHDCPIFVSIGYSAETDAPPRTRKQLSELVFYEKYGKKSKPFI
jgi:nitroreductase